MNGLPRMTPKYRPTGTTAKREASVEVDYIWTGDTTMGPGTRSVIEMPDAWNWLLDPVKVGVGDLVKQVLALGPCDGVTIFGFEPFDQQPGLFHLIRTLKAHGINTWASSGYPLDLLRSTPLGGATLEMLDGLIVMRERKLNDEYSEASNETQIVLGRDN